MLPDTDHFSCVKPSGIDHPGYQFLEDFCRGMELAFPAASTQPAREHPRREHEPSVATAGVYRGLHWDVTVDEEGDAYNEMSYFGVVLPPGSELAFPLAPAEVQSGHFSDFELVRDNRTSEGITLNQYRPGGKGGRRLETKVIFANPPTDLQPACFCLRIRDWNAYSMNMEEYRQKPGWREDGLDYAEKEIHEKDWVVFSLLIRFPEQMIFAKPPFFEVYNDSHDIPTRDDALTASLQKCFHYSMSQRTGVLYLLHPPSPFSYRVAWLLGESPRVVTSPLMPEQRQRQRMFARKLLPMRKAVVGPDSLTSPTDAEFSATQASVELYKNVKSVLAAVAEYVQKLLRAHELMDSENLELSLMVLDENQMEEGAPGGRKLPVLRIVAGTHLHDPAYRDLFLFVGDGNAGRAWKRRMARVFDSTEIEKDPKRHIYVQVSEKLRHQFLISVPLIDPDSAALVYGILNIGTFSDPQAETLRPLGEKQHVEAVTGYAQSFVLTRLIECLNMK